MSEPRTTDADRLLALPVTIEHPAGREVELVFTMRALVEVERQFGSFGDFEDQLNAVLANRLHAPILTFVVRSLDALLWDDPPAVRENRADCLDLRVLSGHVRAILAAWEMAWPVPDKVEEAGPDAAGGQEQGADPNPGGADSAPSPGRAGTTAGSSASDLLPIASGA